ncbi:CAP domain-containing protein [Hankyongella ginsenosidimutans]|uniref:CAP domain-containing protein n=2 Tax=Hankyongella ginsenosidimutans TaxID=1763828 RepID=A0A4D7CBJ4_9SPHN|nr:CAP domain-containing protein [Hankyongella ginsenosidimutans]
MGALSEDPALTEAANQQAREMALQGQLTHVDDKGGTFVERAIGAQYSGQPRAENLAWQQKSATHAATAWLNSPAHQHNILLPDVDDAGFGYACNPETGRFWVLVLGRRGQALLGPLISATPYRTDLAADKEIKAAQIVRVRRRQGPRPGRAGRPE